MAYSNDRNTKARGHCMRKTPRHRTWTLTDDERFVLRTMLLAVAVAVPQSILGVTLLLMLHR